MDIQKEREAFEAWVARNIADGKSMSWEDWCWKAWQEAKAQAVPEGFVLIPKKLPDELNDQLWDFMTDNFVCVNDDGDSFMACDDFDLDKLYDELIESQGPNQPTQFNLDEFLIMEEKLKHKGGVITADLDRFIAYAEMVLEKAKALKEPK